MTTPALNPAAVCVWPDDAITQFTTQQLINNLFTEIIHNGAQDTSNVAVNDTHVDNATFDYLHD